MSDLLNSGYIPPSVPMVDPVTGKITPIWWRFLMAILTRTGGETGLEAISLLQSIAAQEPEDAPPEQDALPAFMQDTADAPPPDDGLDAVLAEQVQDPLPDDGPALPMDDDLPPATDDPLLCALVVAELP